MSNDSRIPDHIVSKIADELLDTCRSIFAIAEEYEVDANESFESLKTV